MTQFNLSQNTDHLIDIALTSHGTNNINYLNAYNAISGDIAAYDKANPSDQINSGTVSWFSQASLVNVEQSSPNAVGTFIWNYTEDAVASEGGTLTNAQMQQSSDDIATKVFNQLENSNFVFDDSSGDKNSFSPQNIVQYDAGTGLADIQGDNPSVQLDSAIWGGTLFATKELDDPTYYSNYGLDIAPGSEDCAAIDAGFEGAAVAEFKAGFIGDSLDGLFNGNLTNNLGLNIDAGAIAACELPNMVNFAVDPATTITNAIISSEGDGKYGITLDGSETNGDIIPNS